MKLLVVEHVMGMLLSPTHTALCSALHGTLPSGSSVVWYKTYEDFVNSSTLCGCDLNLRFVPESVENHMCAMLMWEVCKHKPDAVLFVGGHVYASAMQELKKSGIRTYLWAVDDPHEFSVSHRLGEYCDAVFTIEPETVSLHKRGVLLPHGVISEEVQEVRESANESRAKVPDLVVAGSLYLSRVEYMNKMADTLAGFPQTDVRFFCDKSHPNFTLLHPYWKALAASPTSWDDLQLLYALSPFTLNVHRGVDDSPIGDSMGIKIARGLNQASYSVPALGNTVLCDESRASELYRQIGDLALCVGPEDAAKIVVQKACPLSALKKDVEARRVQAAHDWKTERMPTIIKVLKEDGVC